MESKITFVDFAPRNLRNQAWPIDDYSFRVSDGQEDRYVHVGVNDLMWAREAPTLPRKEVIELADKWLRLCFDKNLEEFSQVRESRTFYDIPRGLLSYWAEHQTTPDWF
jgi:hypothetical protein